MSPIEMAIGTFPTWEEPHFMTWELTEVHGRSYWDIGWTGIIYILTIRDSPPNRKSCGIRITTCDYRGFLASPHLRLGAESGGVGGLLRRLTPTSSAVLRVFSMCLGQQKAGWGGWKMLERTHFVRVFSDWTWIGSHRKKTFGPYLGYLWSTLFFPLKWDLLHPTYVNFHIHICSQAIQENEKRLAEVHQDNHWLA